MSKISKKLSEEHKKKISEACKERYKLDPTLKNRTKHVGKDNGRYIDGRTMQEKYCVVCNKKISWHASKCRVCAMRENRKKFSWVGKKHSKETKNKISKKSSEKFTDEYNKKVRKIFEERKIWLPKKDIDKYKLYYREAKFSFGMQKITKNEKILIKKYGIFSSTNPKGMVRDHKFSVKSGFEKLVYPIILRHPLNCRIITHKENVSIAQNKNKTDNIISLEELLYDITCYSESWKEQIECIKYINKYKNKITFNLGDLF